MPNQANKKYLHPEYNIVVFVAVFLLSFDEVSVEASPQRERESQVNII